MPEPKRRKRTKTCDLTTPHRSRPAAGVQKHTIWPPPAGSPGSPKKHSISHPFAVGCWLLLVAVDRLCRGPVWGQATSKNPWLYISQSWAEEEQRVVTFGASSAESCFLRRIHEDKTPIVLTGFKDPNAGSHWRYTMPECFQRRENRKHLD